MPVKSLKELATVACIKNIKGVDSVGDYLPYANVRPILLKVEHAYQLRQIEINSPQIQCETGEIWLRLIEREFPLEFKANGYKPPTPDKWYRVYDKYKRDHDRALQASEVKLKEALAGLQQSKEMNTSKIVDQKFLPRPPGFGPKRGYGPRESASSVLTFGKGSRTKTTTGASVMRKVRREVQEIANIHGSLSRAVRAPARANQVRKAPSSMVNDYRRASQPSFRPAHEPVEEPSAVADHEKRATYITDSDSEEDVRDSKIRKAPPKLIKKPMVQSATTSSVKKQPSAPSGNVGASTASAPSTTKRSSGILSNKFRGAAPKAQVLKPASSTPTAPPKQQRPADSQPKAPKSLPREEASSPPPARAASSSPPMPASAPAPAPAPLQRKRKAVDIFMRPKRKAL